jgi:hypothetical protein
VPYEQFQFLSHGGTPLRASIASPHPLHRRIRRRQGVEYFSQGSDPCKYVTSLKILGLASRHFGFFTHPSLRK